MLGEKLYDPDHLESGKGSVEGIGLLPTETTYTPGKRRTRYKAKVTADIFKGARIDGYEIHMGETKIKGEPFVELESGEPDGCVSGRVFGTYLHGLFDTGDMVKRVADMLLERRGIKGSPYTPVDHDKYKEEQYDKLADGVREVLDIDKIYEIMEKSAVN